MPPESTPRRKKLTASYRLVEIAVTQNHIDTAIPADSGHCMIADALRTALPHAKGIAVDLQTIRFTDPIKEQRYTYLTPTIAQDTLVAFDQGLPLVPFEFKLRSPIQVIRAGTKQKGESRAHEGTKTTPSNKAIGVRMGGEPLPIAALHTGPGAYPAATREFLSNRNTTAEERPTSQTEAGPVTQNTTTEATSQTESPQVGNVTLSTKLGHTRRYGMRQLRPWNVART